MNEMGKLQKTAVAAAVMVAALTVFAGGRALASTLVVSQSEEPCTTGDSYFHTIKYAVQNANDGDTILVCDGTYTESFTIYQTDLDLESFNLQGATIVAPGYLTPGQAIIEVVNEDFEESTAKAPQVSTAVEEDDVVINGFNITGPAATSGSCQIQAGVFVHEDATATVSNNIITSIRDNPLSGCQQGYGIRVGSEAEFDEEDSDPGTADLFGNTISDYQKGGIFVDGEGSSADITDNVVTGDFKTKVIGQNGIQVSNTSVESTITGNTISDNFYGQPCIKGNCYRATGVLEVNAGERGDLLKIWRNNTFIHNQVRATITPLPKPAK
jgi:hypothetical protein